MAAAYFGEGSYGGASATVLHADASPPDHIIVPDAQLLFTAHFRRAGPDLVLTGRDGHNHIIPGYFASEHRPALVAPSGALLSPDLVDMLAGSAAPNEYAQAGPIAPPAPIGRVEKVVGDVTVVRNGVAVVLNVGDAVYKSDVLQTAANSSCGVAFPDGSALNLVANTRMALSDYVYDPNSTSNSALFNLVEGGLSFVAGKVAHSGDMKIGTPIATMGIRGTAGWLYEEQVANITANAGNVTLHFAAVFDSVTNTESTYTLYAIDANGQLEHDANGKLISLATVSSTQNGLVTTLTGNGINAMPSVTTGPPDFSQQQFANIVVPQVINMAVQAIQQYQQQQQQQQNPTNPQSNPGGTGSGTPPPTPSGNEDQPLQQILNLNGGASPVTITATVSPTPGGSTPPPSPPQSVLTIPTGPTTVIWTPQSGNLWDNSGNWNGGSPGATVNAEVNSPTAAIVNDPEQINNLTVGSLGTLEAVGNSSNPSNPGSLTVAGTTDDSGTIVADSTISDPVITFGNAVTVEAGGAIEAIGAGNTASIIFANSVTLDAAAGAHSGGLIEASGSGASVTFNAGVTVGAGAEIEASGSGASVYITNVDGPQVFNAGLIDADNGGTVTFFDVQVENASGVIEADGAVASGSMVSLISLSGVDIVGGTFETGNPTSALGGEIEVGAGLEATFFDGSTSAGAVTVDAFVQVDDGASLELLGTITDEGTISVQSGATLILSGASVSGTATNTIVDDGNIEVAAPSTINGGIVVNGDIGGLTIDSGVTLTADDVTLENLDVTNNGTVQTDFGDTLKISGTTIDGGTIVDNGTIEISGAVTIAGAVVQGTGQIAVDSGATLYLEGSSDTLDGVSVTGNIQVDGSVQQTTLTLEGGAAITNGTLSIGPQGIVDVATSASGPGATLTNVTVDNSGQINVQGTLYLDGGSISGGAIDLALGSASLQPIYIAINDPNDPYEIGPAVSANGQFIAFIASADLPGQGGGDTQGEIELYSVATDTNADISAQQNFAAGVFHEGETFSDVPSISDNGQFVVFDGKYTSGGNQTEDALLYNSHTHQVTLIATDANGATISGNGAVIAYESSGNNANGSSIVVQGEPSGTVTIADGNSDDFAASFGDPALSDDGRYVSFWSTANDIAITQGASTFTFNTGNTAESSAEVYVYDTLTHTLKEASPGIGGVPGDGNSGTLDTGQNSDSSWRPELSGNGRFVVFQSTADNLVTGVGDAGNDVSNIFLYDTHTGKIVAVTDADGEVVTGNSIRPSISADGKNLTFSSDDSNLPGANGGWQTYMVSIDPSTGTLGTPELLSAGFAGTDNGQSNLASTVSDGGGVTAFGGAVLAFNSQQGQATISGGTITFSDLSLTDFNVASDTSDRLTLTISVTHGTLVAAGSGGTGQQSLTITGTLAQIDAALQTGVTYTPGSPPSAADTLSLQVTDQTSGAAASFASQFNPGATDPSQLFSGQPTTTGQYDIFLSEQQTIDVTADTRIDGGAQIEGGLINISSGVTLTLNGITDTDTSIHDFSTLGSMVGGGAVAFTGSSTLEGTGIFGGTNQSGQPTGQVTVGSGAALILDDVVLKNVAVTVTSDGTTPSFQIDAGHTLTWAGTSSFGGPGSIIIDNNGHIIHDGTLDVGFSQVTFDGSGTNTHNGGNIDTEAETLINNGNTFDGYGTFGNLTTIENESGSFDADVAGQALVLSTGKTIVNDGSFIADGGILKVLDAVTEDPGQTGSAIIEHDGTLELGSTDSQAVTFNDASTLVLDHQQQGVDDFTGTIQGVSAGDVLDLTGFNATSEDSFQIESNYNAGSNITALTVVDASQDETSAPIFLSGNYTNPNDFSIASDGHGGIDVTALPVTSFNPTYLSFNDDSQVALGAPPSTQTDNVTMAGWINWTGGNTIGHQEVLFYNGATNNQGYGLIAAPTEDGLDLQVLAGGVNVLDTNIALSANQWYFVALTRVDGIFHVYVDGTDLFDAGLGVNAITSGQMQIGGLGAFIPSPEVFSGSIADVSVWNTALSQSQIQAIQGTYLSGNEAGLAGYYPLSNGSGATAADSVNSAGNLTLSGNPTWVVDGSNSWTVTGGDVPENTSATLVGLSVSNVNPDDTITVIFDVNDGALTLGSTAGLSDTGLGTGAVTLTGTESEIDAALASGLTYTPTAGFVGGDTLTFVAGGGGVASSPDSLAINVTGPADFWGQEQFPAVVQGEHLFGVNPQYDSLAGIVALAYDDTSGYSTSDTSFTLTTNVESLDPFFLPRPHSAQTGSSFTVQAPGRYNLIVPNIDYSASNSPDGVAGPSPIGIYVFKGEVDSVNGIWQIFAIPDSNGDGGVTLGNPTEVGTTPTTDETIFNLKETFHNSGGFASSYAVAWDQFSGTNTTTGAYSVELQLVGINNSAGSFAGVFNATTVFTVSLASNVAETALPAWDFKPGDGNYVLATAESSGGTDNVIHFESYKINDTGTGIVTGSLAFTVQPNLSAYEPGATNEIVQPVVATLSPYPGQVAEALQFAQSPDNGSDYFIAWNETVTDSQGTHDQVEFAVATSAGTELSLPSSISTFQTDGQPQNVRVGEFTDPVNSSQDDVVVVYGDDTGTHILEYAVTNSGGTVSLIADFTDPTTQAFDNLTVMGDGRIAITYDDSVNALPDETSQYDFRIFDLRTAGLNIDDSSLSDGLNKYIAGTHFSDGFTGENNVNNEYYFVGQDGASGTTPADTFHGGSGGWNIAIFADARSDYTISTQIVNGPNITTIASNGDDPAHTGSLAVTNVEFLAFDPASDPTPQNNIIDVNGGTFVILGGNSAITIEAGATAEIDSAASGETFYAGNVSFAGSTGILQVDQLSELTGQISGITHGDPNQVLDLDGFNAQSGDHFSVSTVLNSSENTVLTVTDTTSVGQPSESVTLVGDYTGDTWTATNDGHGGVNVIDPTAETTLDSSITVNDGNPPVQTVLGSGPFVIDDATAHLSEPGSEAVTFAGSFGTFIVDNPSTFTGTVSGISGSADVIDLGGFASQHGDVFAISTAYNGADTTLTVTDTSNNIGPESITLAGNYTGDVFTAADDGNGGADVVGSPAANTPSVVSTASGDSVSGVVTFADANVSDNLSMAADGLNYVGSNSASGQSIDANGNMAVNFSVDINNDQINLASGQTLTQSYDVALRNTDPTADQNQTVSVTIGGAGNDNFVFAPGVGADTVVNFNPQQDTIELDHFSAAQTVQELQSLITSDAHGDAVINLGHNDSVTLANTTTAQLQQAIQNGHILLH